ncbi:uncharacterized protein LOC119189979 [Manduca sexta]|uniref:uncharacterized protein LOC119189979 n=1 Tax=Manduca sexta TaxID=7130 RepID=UPI00188E3669|nr:uncharacterized protein LOC119189979 [Manduca sexta]
MCFEYILLVINALLTKKKKMHNYFKNLSQFDQTLKVSSDNETLNAKKGSLIWIFIIFIYNAMEICMILFKIMNSNEVTEYVNMIFYYIISLVHDMEQIFFFTLLRTIFTRLKLLRAHVRKTFRVNDAGTSDMKTDKIETLSNNAQLDIGSLHKVYELLHKCSEQLNSIMSFPMLMMLFTSGFSTTLLLKILVKIIQVQETMDPKIVTIAVIYLVVRCVKYTLLVVMPCYYSSITSSQVATIRTTLHDSLNTMPLDKLERRRVKAFFLLTKESEFVYALAGFIRLNMTLPLSYTSLCTTYLVIIIQFSKFLD